MDGPTFDRFTRSLSLVGSRRHALTGLLAGALGFRGAQTDPAAAKKKKPCPPCKKRKQGKCKKKLPDGTACASGICQGGRCVAAGPALPPPSPPPPPACGPDQRSCPGRGGCIPTAQCCTDTDCTPGTCDMATGFCFCNAPFKRCPGEFGPCALCCVNDTGGDDCPGTTKCREHACHCPAASGPCGCPEAVASPPIACGTGYSCFCYIDMSDTTPPQSAQCGSVVQSSDVCTSAATCDPGEFCGARTFSPASGGVCTTTCA